MGDQPLTRPQPKHTPVNAPFWKASAAGKLSTPICTACGQRHFPPSPRCPHCSSGTLEWSHVSGRGKLISWVVFHHSYWDIVKDELPYTVCTVDLEEGVRLISNLVGEAERSPRYAMDLEVDFQDLTSGERLPVFRRPAGG